MNERVSSPFLKEISFSDLIGFKCVHLSFFFCWFGLILAGTTIIGFGASNYSLTFNYCAESEKFCSQDIILDAEKDLFFYIKLDPFYQNNRL